MLFKYFENIFNIEIGRKFGIFVVSSDCGKGAIFNDSGNSPVDMDKLMR